MLRGWPMRPGSVIPACRAESLKHSLGFCTARAYSAKVGQNTGRSEAGPVGGERAATEAGNGGSEDFLVELPVRPLTAEIINRMIRAALKQTMMKSNTKAMTHLLAPGSQVEK